ncbi:MAG: hypothetical protein BMS9Abin05_2733 [Rhodothermia bacterium]|nr:MAG: hypothetical protein BMS9Abin05_2733 [Rhodothermia bacterium]
MTKTDTPGSRAPDLQSFSDPVEAAARMPSLAEDERRADIGHTLRGTVVCVLGMHRSGTSYLIGSLQKSGLFLGTHFDWNPYNQRGNRENPEVFTLHEDLLASNGGSWENPPEVVTWASYHFDRARALLSKYAGDGPWGFKDPRTLLILSGWKRVTNDIRFVGIFRSPIAVAHSLHLRNGTPLERAMRLWNHYNRLLLDEYERQPFPVICFDWHEDVLHEKINTIVTALGLRAIDRNNRFFASDLRHYHDSAENHLPEESIAIYRRLQSISLR